MRSKLGDNRRESLQNMKAKKEKSTDSFALEKSFEKNFHTVDRNRRGTVEEGEEEHNQSFDRWYKALMESSKKKLRNKENVVSKGKRSAVPATKPIYRYL